MFKCINKQFAERMSNEHGIPQLSDRMLLVIGVVLHPSTDLFECLKVVLFLGFNLGQPHVQNCMYIYKPGTFSAWEYEAANSGTGQ